MTQEQIIQKLTEKYQDYSRAELVDELDAIQQLVQLVDEGDVKRLYNLKMYVINQLLLGK